MKMICENCKKECERKSNNQKYCKKCSYLKRLERNREYDRKRSKSNHRKNWTIQYYNKIREKKRKRDREYYQKNKEKLKKYYEEYRKKNKEKILMRTYAFKFLKGLKGNKCENCGSNENLQLHHKEYTQLNKKEFREEDVKKLMLLCAKCHRFLHQRGRMPTFKCIKC